MHPEETDNLAADKPSQAQVDLTLRELESLPTPPAVARRALELAATQATGELAELVRCDAAMTAKLLARLAQGGCADRELWRAYASPPAELLREVAIGVEADGEASAAGQELWRHNLATAIAAGMLAPAVGEDAGEAYVCGLLHDLGKLAARGALPKSYRRVEQALAEGGRSALQCERELLGVEHTVLGRRLAEMWRLPAAVQQVAWLHHQPIDSLPETVMHRKMVAMIGLANALAHELNAGNNGGGDRGAASRAESLGVSREQVERVRAELTATVSRRSAIATAATTEAAASHTAARAIAQLAQENERLRDQVRELTRQAQAVEGLREFTAGLGGEATIADVLPRVGALLATAANVEPSADAPVVTYSISQEIPEVLCVVQNGSHPAWMVLSRTGATLATPPPNAAPATDAARQLLGPSEELSLYIDLASCVHLPLVCEGRWIGGVFLARGMGVPPMCGTGVSPVSAEGILPSLLDSEEIQKQRRNSQDADKMSATRPDMAGTAMEHMGETPMPHAARTGTSQQIAAMALAMVQGRARAVLLGEQFTRATQVLDQAQEALTETRTLSAIVEMAAGAAHELNNPLAIISGRAQLMLAKASTDQDRKLWSSLAQQAQRISDIISELMAFASPPPPQVTDTPPAELLREAAARLAALDDAKARAARVDIAVAADAPAVRADREQVLGVLIELMLNAATASGQQPVIHLAAQAGPQDNQVTLIVRDEGPGMDRDTLAKAFTPFFSAQQANRRRGLGLPKARRTIEANAGRIHLHSEPGKGATAIVQLPAK